MHLTDDKLLAFSSGALNGPELRQVEEHIDTCDSCRALVAAWLNVESRADAAPAPAAGSVPARPGDEIARYQVRGVLGTGGMGIVYEAYDPALRRKVALKLLHPDLAERDATRARLVREAQITAQVIHPNVVTVHEVGVAGDRMFIAMELISGHSAREWLQQPRPRDEVLTVFAAAGRGLAEAHARGVVHRDFKPGNVMIARDGQIKVMDFGLARGGADPEPAVETSGTVAELAATQTRSGVILGTPAYMAPEQFAGLPGTAASDQFSFCVALYEALVGSRPFAGATYDELRDAVMAGRIESSARARLAGHVERALHRGLSRDPAARYPGMPALLADLAPRSRRWPLWVAAAAGIAAIGAAWTVLVPDGGDACRDAAARVSWPETRRNALRAAFGASAHPAAPSALASIESALDARVTRWRASMISACEDTRVRRTHSDQVLHQRTACLDRRWRESTLLLEQIISRAAQAPNPSQLVDAVHALPPIAACDQPDEPALADDPARRAQVAAVEDALLSVQTLRRLGDYQMTLARSLGLVVHAAAVPHPPVLARAWYEVGSAELELGAHADAVRSLERSIALALATGDDSLVTEAMADLVYARGYRQKAHAEVLSWLPLAGIALHRTDNLASRAALERSLGIVLADAGRHDEALARFENALAMQTRALGAGHPTVAATHSNLGLLLGTMRQLDRALEHHQRAIDIQERASGPVHPRLARYLNNLGNVLSEQGANDRAEKVFRQALAIYETSPSAPGDRASALTNLASLLRTEKRLDEARTAIETAVRLREQALGPDHPDVARSLNELAVILRLQGDHAAARQLLLRVLDIRKARLGPDHPLVVATYQSLGVFERAIAGGDCKLALPYFEQAREILVAKHGEVPDADVTLLVLLAWCHAEPAPDQAISFAEKALSIYERTGASPADLAYAKRALGWTLWSSHRDRKRALQLSREARDLYRTAGAGSEKELAKMEQFLAQHDR